MKKVLFLALAIVLISTGCTKNTTGQKELSIEEARLMITDFINNDLGNSGATIKEIVDEGAIYKVVVDLGQGQEIDSYLTKDGMKFFPQVMDIEETKQKIAESKDQPGAEQQQPDVPKKDKVSVELFVMSHCPYGTQIEKGMLPVLEALGDKIDFTLKFCDYAMHPSQGEVEEQLNQYCIQKEEPAKLTTYLKCFLEAGNGADCLAKANINQAKFKKCVSDTDKEYKVMELLEDKESWKSGRFPQFNIYAEDAAKYGVSGSPGLVINGVKTNSGRSPSSLLKAICAGFNTPPAECETELDSANPSPGFGFGADSNASASGGCGS